MLHSTHTFNHLVLTNMYQLQYNLNKVKHDRTSHIWLNQTFCSGFHHQDLTRKYQYCTYFRLRRKFKDLWSVLLPEWTFLPGLTNFTTEDNQALTFKISSSTQNAHFYHVLYGFNLALTHLLPLTCFGKSLKHLQTPNSWQSALCDRRDLIPPVPQQQHPRLARHIWAGHVISNNICNSTSCPATLRNRNLGKYPTLAQMCQWESPPRKEQACAFLYPCKLNQILMLTIKDSSVRSVLEILMFHKNKTKPTQLVK